MAVKKIEEMRYNLINLIAYLNASNPASALCKRALGIKPVNLFLVK